MPQNNKVIDEKGKKKNEKRSAHTYLHLCDNFAD